MGMFKLCSPYNYENEESRKNSLVWKLYTKVETVKKNIKGKEIEEKAYNQVMSNLKFVENGEPKFSYTYLYKRLVRPLVVHYDKPKIKRAWKDATDKKKGMQVS